MRNFEEDVLEFKSRKLITQVKDNEELKTVLLQFVKDPRNLIEQSVKAHNYINLKMGSLERTWFQISRQSKMS